MRATFASGSVRRIVAADGDDLTGVQEVAEKLDKDLRSLRSKWVYSRVLGKVHCSPWGVVELFVP